MSDEQTPAIGAPSTSPVGTTGVGATPAKDADRAKVAQLAQEFEAMLMTQMLRDMRSSMLDEESDSDGGGFGRDTMQDTADIALGQALSRVGGIGLSSVLMKALDQRLLGAGAPAAGAGTATVGVPTYPQTVVSPDPTGPGLAGQPPMPTLHVPARGGTESTDLGVPGGPISSGYGWRRDPLTGMAAFHKGIDVAQPYGQNVQAAASGRVAFAGDQGGYGTMVIVDHGQGRQTRYAHLSGTSVKAGDTVESGQVIGTIGTSGRSTGPHLHFEMLTDGQPVDPMTGH